MSGPLMRVFSTGRKELASLMPTVQSVSWILNDVGQAQFFVPYTDPNCTTDILSIGNFILFEWVYPEHVSLPAFGGVIDVPRSRGSNGVVLTAYTGERILSWFETGAQDSTEAVTAGAIYKDLIDAAKVKHNPGLVLGDIYDAGDALSKEWTNSTLLDVIRNLSTESGQDFNFLPVADMGELEFHYYWYLSQGHDVSNAVLFAEGVNVGSAILDEQGPIVNQVTVYGAGSVWDNTRLTGNKNDPDSLTDYGWRERSLIDQDSKSQTTVDVAASQYLADHKDPVTRISLEGVTDEAPGYWRDFKIGDLVSVDVNIRGAAGGWRIQDKYRIIGMQWNVNNTMRLDLMAPAPGLELGGFIL